VIILCSARFPGTCSLEDTIVVATLGLNQCLHQIKHSLQAAMFFENVELNCNEGKQLSGDSQLPVPLKRAALSSLVNKFFVPFRNDDSLAIW